MNATEAAKALLTAFETELVALGVTLPERRYVAPGQIAVWDGEQLALNLSEIVRGQPGALVETTTPPVPTVLAAHFSLQLVRAVPALSNEGPMGAMVPEEGDLNTSGLQSVADADALSLAAINIQQAHTTDEAGMGFSIGPLSTLGPDGGMAAVMLKLAVSLD